MKKQNPTEPNPKTNIHRTWTKHKHTFKSTHKSQPKHQITQMEHDPKILGSFPSLVVSLQTHVQFLLSKSLSCCTSIPLNKLSQDSVHDAKRCLHLMRNIFSYSTWVRWVVSFDIMQFNEFEYHFASVVRTFTFVLSWVLAKWYLQF